MVKEHALGKMEENTQENFNLTKNMDKESIHGVMVANTTVSGNMVNKTVFFEFENLGFGKYTTKD